MHALARRNPKPVTDTPAKGAAFRRWFGQSAVVDAKGKPLVVYHGTTAGGFDAFRPNYRKGEQLGFGIHFAADREFAAKYADDPNVRRKGGTSPKVYEVYLSIQRPLVADAIVREGSPEFALAKKLAGAKLMTQRDEQGVPVAYMQGAIDKTSAERAERLIREAGYDGIVYEAMLASAAWTGAGVGRRRDAVSRSYVVFDPTQVKSATGNVGTFDPADPSILRNPAKVLRVIRLAAKDTGAGFVYDLPRVRRNPEDGPARIRLTGFSTVRKISPEVEAFLRDLYEASYPNALSSDPSSRILANAKARVEVTPMHGGVHIDELEAGSRGQGAGTEAMRFLTELADKHGVSLFLQAHPFGDERMSLEALERFYRRHGFRSDDEEDNDDEATAMHRWPREVLRANPAKGAAGSAAFRRWFGRSKVTDARGKPLVVYHGAARSGFDAFRKQARRGIFFSDIPEVAWTYTHSDTDALATRTATDRRKGKPALYEVYLRMENPLVVDARGSDWASVPVYGMPEAQREAVLNAVYPYASALSTDDLVTAARKLKYDGVIIRNVVDIGDYTDYDGTSTIYAVFEPTQVKSANMNAGTFDPADRSILRNPARKAKPRTLAEAGLPSTWFHGTQKTFGKLKAQSSACVWLADKAGAMAYATPHYGRLSAVRLIEVVLASDTRVVDLADASDPAVREFIRLDASASNLRWHGREDVTDAELAAALAHWQGRKTHYDAIEARPWAKAHFRKAGADALLVRDVAGWGGHAEMPSLCLLNAKKVVSERDVAPDLSLVRAENMPKYENPHRRSAPQGAPMKTSQNGPDVTGRTPPSGLRIEFYDEQGDNDDRDERLAEAAWKIAHASPIRILSNKSLSAIAVLGRKVVGGGWYSVDMSHSDDEPSQFSFDIVVAPGAQGKGVGDALVKEMLDQFRHAAHGHDELALNVEVVNPAMERILVRRGFRVRDEEDPLAVRGRTMMTKNPRRRKNGFLGAVGLLGLGFAGGAYLESEKPFVKGLRQRSRVQAERLQRDVFTPASRPTPAPATRTATTDPAWRRERSPEGKGYSHLRTLNGVDYEVWERIYNDGGKAIFLEAGDKRERILAPNGEEDGWVSVAAAKKAAEADAKTRKNPRRRK
jgi:GNAT superfamily N-acetyltransferase